MKKSLLAAGLVVLLLLELVSGSPNANLEGGELKMEGPLHSMIKRSGYRYPYGYRRYYNYRRYRGYYYKYGKKYKYYKK